MEREPECSATVAGLAANLLFTAEGHLGPARELDLARLGIEADRLRSDDDPERALQRALFETASARVSLAQGLPFRGVELAREALAHTRAAADGRARFASFLEARANTVLGASWESLFETQRAAEVYERAHEVLVGLVEGDRGLAEILVALVPFLHGEGVGVPDEVVRGVLRQLWFQVGSDHIESAIGRARCRVKSAPTDATAWIDDVGHAIEKVGLGVLSPILLVDLVHHSDAGAAQRLLDTILRQAGTLDLDVEAFRSVLLPAAALAAAERGEDPTVFLSDAKESLSRQADPLLVAAGTGLSLLVEPGRGPELTDAEEQFLRAIREVLDVAGEAFHDLRVRAVLERPLALLTDRVAAIFDATGAAEDRVRLAELLDSLGDASKRFDNLLLGAGDARIAGRDRARDRLGRLLTGLTTWPDAAYLGMREVDHGTLFLAASARTGFFVARADESFRRAAHELTDKVAYETEVLELVCEAAPEDEFEPAGRAVYDALPPAVRELIAAHRSCWWSPTMARTGTPYLTR